MLAEDIHEQSAPSVIDSLPCNVRLPEKLRANFEQRGPTPTKPGDERRFTRVRCRSLNHRAGLKYQPTYAPLERDGQWRAVYVADFSKEGVQVIHSEQIFPGERLQLFLMTGSFLLVEARRCRRIGPHCFSVGVQIVKSDKSE